MELCVDDFCRSPSSAKIPNTRKEFRLYLDTGRSAIFAALLSIIGRGGKKEAWLPRYCCPSVIWPFMKLDFRLNFYSLGRDLRSPLGLPDKLDGETLLFIHYFGKINHAFVDYLIDMRRGSHFFVIEDCVQSLLNHEVGAGDYAVYSYRKYLPQPDGALLVADFPLEKIELAPASEIYVSLRLIGKLIRCRGDSESFLDLFSRAEDMIDNFICPREMSFLSGYLLARCDGAAIARKRRENFFYLNQLLADQGWLSPYLSPLFDSLEDHEVPLGLPVLVDPACRNRLRCYLMSQNIFCPVHWSCDDLYEKHGWDDEAELSRSLLTLPIDQRLNYSDLDRLCEKLGRFFG